MRRVNPDERDVISFLCHCNPAAYGIDDVSGTQYKQQGLTSWIHHRCMANLKYTPIRAVPPTWRDPRLARLVWRGLTGPLCKPAAQHTGCGAGWSRRAE